MGYNDTGTQNTVLKVPENSIEQKPWIDTEIREFTAIRKMLEYNQRVLFLRHSLQTH
jgi:hypothetical protein